MSVKEWLDAERDSRADNYQKLWMSLRNPAEAGLRMADDVKRLIDWMDAQIYAEIGDCPVS